MYWLCTHHVWACVHAYVNWLPWLIFIFQVKDLKGTDIPALEASFQSINAEIQKLSAEIAEVC